MEAILKNKTPKKERRKKIHHVINALQLHPKNTWRRVLQIGISPKIEAKISLQPIIGQHWYLVLTHQ
jgi:hypothetical protein